jgi:ribosomal protein L29
MKMEDIRALSDQELVHQELQLERDLIQARFSKKLESQDDSSVFAKFRKDIARLRTEQRTREMKMSQKVGRNHLRNLHRSSFEVSSGGSSGGSSSGAGFLKGLSAKLSSDSEE